MVNGRATKDASQNGSWSEGEFASSLNALLSPYSATEFRNKRPVTIVNRQAYKYDYTIDQPRSAWRIETEGQSYQPGYDGSIWIDKETFRVLRIEMAARNMPRSFPIDTTESSLDYDFVLIGEQKYLLPVHSELVEASWRGISQCSRNVIDFRNYKKYTADSSIGFEGARQVRGAGGFCRCQGSPATHPSAGPPRDRAHTPLPDASLPPASAPSAVQRIAPRTA